MKKKCQLCEIEGTLQSCTLCGNLICHECRLKCDQCKSWICEKCITDNETCPVCHSGTLYRTRQQPRKLGIRDRSDYQCECGQYFNYIEYGDRIKLECPRCHRIKDVFYQQSD